MGKMVVDSITPKEIHSLWLLLRHGDLIKEKDLIKTGQKVFEINSTAPIKRLVEIGEKLNFIVLNQNSLHKLTLSGKEFASCDNWRYWKPTEKFRSLLDNDDIYSLFSIPHPKERPFVIDLFAGVGGLALGFEAGGFHVGLAVDNDPQAAQAHKINFPESCVVKDDINVFAQAPKAYIEKHGLGNKKVAGIIGGPPCQGFSYIGERTDSDERNLLTTKFMDIVLNLEPDFFVMENVPGLATSGIPPKFSIHVVRLAKSIGVPATAIVHSLPNLPNSIAKRDRQFRKRFVSGIISSFKLDLQKELPRDISASELAVYIPNALEMLLRNFSIKSEELYKDTALISEVRNALENESASICTIVIASVIESLLENKIITDLNCESFLKEIAFGLKAESNLKYAAEKLFVEYDSIPLAATYKGKRVGPIISHLIKRASTKYNVAPPTVLNAAWFGTPQSRQRLFLVGIRKDLNVNPTLPDARFVIPNSGKSSIEATFLETSPTAKEAIQDLPNVDEYAELVKGDKLPIKELKTGISDYAKEMRLESIDKSNQAAPSPNWNPFFIDCCNRTLHADFVIERLKLLGPGIQEETSHKPRLHPDKCSPTLRAGTRESKGSHTAVRPIHYEHHRVVTVREGARLMGYPDWMTFHPTKWHGFRLVGNGVPYHLAHAVGEHLYNLIYEANPNSGYVKEASSQKPTITQQLEAV